MTVNAIRISNLSKRYLLGQTRGLGSLVRPWRQRPTAQELWALRDVSLDIAEGEAMGIIGHNGSGKSTLLKVLARIIEPTRGRIELRGRVASLLEVGTGFHPDLSGRENIYLNGAILGMKRREIAAKFDTIVDFSGVEQFLDTPVKRYSSGMRVRLAFAVAAHLDPEVLIVDEVLAVGDAAFQARCLGKMQGLVTGEGRTVLFVSHTMQAVRGLCRRVAWLDRGQLREIGTPDAVIPHYLDGVRGGDDRGDLGSRIAAIPPDPDFQLLDASVTQHGAPALALHDDRPLEISMMYRVHRPVHGLRVFFDVCDEYGEVLIRSFHDERDTAPHHALPGVYRASATLPAHLLAPRQYRVVLQAGIFNVRDCLSGGLPVPISVQNSSRLNIAYSSDVVHGKIQPRVAWDVESLDESRALESWRHEHVKAA